MDPSDILALQKALEEAEERVESERQRAESERQRAESERQRAESERQRADKNQQRAEKNQQQLQSSTFEECIRLAHNRLQLSLEVESDKKLTTLGTTSVKNKFYPKTLKHWSEYLNEQRQLLDIVYKYLHPNDTSAKRFFGSSKFFEEMGNRLRKRKLANERDLHTWQRIAVEDVVAEVLNTLYDIPEARAELSLEPISFENHDNSLSDTAEEVCDRLDLQTPRESSDSDEATLALELPRKNRGRPSRSRADQFCVFRGKDEERKMLTLAEYKPPHKYPSGNIKAGFRPMILKEEVFDRIDIPVWTEKEGDLSPSEEEAKEAKLQYNADKICAAVATQTFHSMVQSRLPYGYITTGEAIVLLHVPQEDPSELYYHTAIPGQDVSPDDDSIIYQTAVCHLLCICLLSFRSKQYSHKWLTAAKENLDKHHIDPEAVLRKIPESEKKQTPKSVAYRGRRNPRPKLSPYITRSFTRRRRDDEPHSDDEDTASGADPSLGGSTVPSSTTEPHASSSGQGGFGKEAATSVQTERPASSTVNLAEDGETILPYCTMACLLGVANGSAVDETCPNAAYHHQSVDGRHALDAGAFVKAVRDQLAEDPDDGCTPLGIQGARGALFRIVLVSHRYVLVAKGTVRAFIPDLIHEARVYDHLKAQQGSACPVSLGDFRLKHWYGLDFQVKIRHMLLLAWGGEVISADMFYTSGVARTVREIREAGIEQRDTEPRNLLWNSELDRVLMIDFERAMHITPSSVVRPVKFRSALTETSPNSKRKPGTDYTGQKEKRLKHTGTCTGGDAYSPEAGTGNDANEDKTEILHSYKLADEFNDVKTRCHNDMCVR